MNPFTACPRSVQWVHDSRTFARGILVEVDYCELDGVDGMPKPVDERPGVLPDISIVDGSIVYVFTVAGTGHEHLVIRCDSAGQIWMAIVSRSSAMHPLDQQTPGNPR